MSYTGCSIKSFKLETVLLTHQELSCHLHQVVLLVLSGNTMSVSYLTEQEGDSFASALWPCVVDIAAGADFSTRDTDSPYSVQIEGAVDQRSKLW